MSAGWESGRGGSRLARHEWKGLSKMGGSLEDWVERRAQEGSTPTTRRSTRLQQLSTRGRRTTMPGTFEEEDSDSD
jgi:WD repeat-containing protein 23